MTNNNFHFRKIINPTLLYIISLILCTFHFALCLLNYFIDTDPLRTVEYILCAILAAAAILYFFSYRPKIHLGLEQGLLILMGVCFLLSCLVMSSQLHKNWFLFNKNSLVDTAIALFVFFPLGRYISRSRKEKGLQELKMITHILLFCWTVFMLYVLIQVFRPVVINLPNGGQIGMNAYKNLSLNCNANTAGAWQIVFFSLCLCMIIWCKHPIAKVYYCIATIINYFILVLSDSRAAYYSVLIGAAAILFLYSSQIKPMAQHKHRFALAACIAVVFGIVFYFLRNITFNYYDSVSHLSELLNSSKTPSADSQAADIKELSSAVSSISVLSGRTTIWSLSLKGMVSSAQRFFTGVTPSGVVSLISLMSDGQIKNMYTHNELLEIGCALGVPALCAFIAWFIQILKNCFALLQKTWDYSLILIPVIIALFIANMLEATLLFYEFITGHVFFLICGWICGKAE